MSQPTGELGWVPKVLLRHLTTSVVVCQKYIVGPQFFTLFESSLKWTVLGRRERSFDIWLNNQNIESAGSWIELKRHFLNLISLLKYFWPSTLKSLDRPFIGDQSLLSDYPVDLTWPSVSTIAAKSFFNICKWSIHSVLNDEDTQRRSHHHVRRHLTIRVKFQDFVQFMRSIIIKKSFKPLFLHYLSLLDRSNGKIFLPELRERLSMPNEHCIQRILTQLHQKHSQNYDLFGSQAILHVIATR